MYIRTTSLETRAKYIKAILSTNIIDKMTLKEIFNGVDHNNDRFPIELNGVKHFMTYKEVNKYKRKNKIKNRIELRRTKEGKDIMNRNFNEMLELYYSNSSKLTEDKICEFMKEADSYRRFIIK